MWNTSCESPLANKLQTHKSHSRLLRFDLKHTLLHTQVLSLFNASVIEMRTHLRCWITGTLPTSRWVRGQGEVVLVSDPKFHHVYFLKVESGLRACQKRLWKRKTILSLLPFLSLLWTFCCYWRQKLCRNVACVRASFSKRGWNSTLFAAVKVHRGKETQRIHVKCQSRMIRAVTVQSTK